MALETNQSQEAILNERNDFEDNAEITPYRKNALRFDDEHVYAVVVLGEDLVMEATIDTGSTKSLISKYFADELKTADNIIKVKTVIKLADDSTVTAEEALVIDIKLGNRCRRTKLLILPQVRDEVILGIDFLYGVDATLQLCGEVIKLQYSKLMKEKEENDIANVNGISNIGNISMKDNGTAISVLLSKTSSNNNTLTVQATNTSFEKHDKKPVATIPTFHTGVTIHEDRLHSLPLTLQQEIAKMKQSHPQTNLNFERKFNGERFNIQISRNGTTKVTIYNTSQQQQANNQPTPINQKPIPSIITYPQMLAREFQNQTTKQLPFIPVECSPAALASTTHMPQWPNAPKYMMEDTKNQHKTPATFLNQASMLSPFIPNVYPSVAITIPPTSAVHKPQLAGLANHISQTDEQQPMPFKKNRAGKQVKRRTRLRELKTLIPLAEGYNKQRLLAEEIQLKKESKQKKKKISSSDYSLNQTSSITITESAFKNL